MNKRGFLQKVSLTLSPQSPPFFPSSPYLLSLSTPTTQAMLQPRLHATSGLRLSRCILDLVTERTYCYVYNRPFPELGPPMITAEVLRMPQSTRVAYQKSLFARSKKRKKMPLLLEQCGFTLRSATIAVGFLSVVSNIVFQFCRDLSRPS